MRVSMILLFALPVLMAFEGGGGSPGFMAGVLGIASTIGAIIRSWLAITAEQLLRLINLLKDAVIRLAGELVVSMYRLGQVLARSIIELAKLAVGGLRDLAIWTYRHALALSAWLREKLGPVLRFIARLKDEIRHIYDTFVRPVIEALDFIRQLNTILSLFHVDVLQSLDAKIGELERRIREPFVWIEARLTEVQNWINRIITLDGLIQRFTLLASMARNAPPWVSGFWNSQIDRGELGHRIDAIPTEIDADPPEEPGEQLAAFFRGDGGDFADDIDGLMPFWRVAAGLDPPGSAG